MEPYHLLVIDNGSTETETLRILRDAVEGDDRITVIRNEQNEGVAVAWNQGIDFARQGGFSMTAFLNNDLVLPEQWDVRLKKPLEDFDVWLSSFCDTEDYWTGYWFMVKTGLFDRIGIFTTEFGKYGGEDSDFMFRMKRAGYGWKNVKTAGLGKMYHFGSGSVSELFPIHEKYLTHQHSMRDAFYRKWPEAGDGR